MFQKNKFKTQRQPQTTSRIEVKDTNIRRLIDRLQPQWHNLPWMYTLPGNKQDQSSWLDDWSLFTLKWCRYENRHLISVPDILHSPSFKSDERALSENGVQKILEYLSNTKLAKWWDQEHSRLRVYWRPLDEWSDIIYMWSLDGGGSTISPYKLKAANGNFSSLPLSDLKAVIGKLVSSKRAEWLDRKKHIIRIKI